MIVTLILIGSRIAPLAGGLVAGLFLIFSNFMMRALRLATPAAGIEVMQTLNREIYCSATMVFPQGMVVLSALLAAVALVQPVGPASALLIVGALLYLIGVIGVSFAFNIPMNHRLEALRAQAEQAADYWRTQVPRWSFWNNVRTVASTAAAACFLLAGLLLASSG